MFSPGGPWRVRIASVVLAAYVMASQPMWPMALLVWVGTMVGSLGLTERFPCESCGCGCVSARSCWLGCCCFNDDERVAWAEREGQPIPDYARGMLTAALARRAEVTKGVIASGKPKCPLCVSHAPAKLVKAVALMSALKCRGVPEWLAVGCVPSLRVAGVVVMPPMASGEVLISQSEWAAAWPLVVEPPPPRA